MPEGVAAALRWYLALAAVGAGGLLPSLLLFERLRSGGVLYARPLALLAVAYLAWTGAAVGAAPYGTPLVVAAAAVLWVWSAALAWRRPALLTALRRRARVLIAGEALFIALFALMLLARVQAPAAQHTEKPMDLMLLTAVHEASELPPADPWFSGRRVSYYHLGHTGVDATARLAGVQVGSAFTLGVATAGALAGAAVFALAGDVLALSGTRRRATPWVAGGVAVASLLALSTLEGPLELLAASGIGGEGVYARLGVEGLPAPPGATNGVPDGFWWWWRATRILPGTITEFPAFSLILGDLHAHLMALPLATVALAVALLSFAGGMPLTWRSWLRRPGALALVALLYAGLAMTNSWDAALYGAVWLAAGLASFLAVGWRPFDAAFAVGRYIAVPAALALLLAWPFLSTIEAAAPGVGLERAGSDPARFALVWLPVLLPAAAAALLLRTAASRRAAGAGGALSALPVLAWVAAALAAGNGDALAERGAGWIVLAALVLALGAAAAASLAARRRGDHGQAAWLALLAAAAAIVLATELVRVNDELGQRFNTVFKFWYGVWLLLAVAGGAAIADAYDRLGGAVLRRGVATVAATGLTAVFAVALLYAPAAAVSRAREGQARGLDALAYLRRADPPAAVALDWVRTNLDGDDVLLEAVVSSYAPAPRLSAASAVPTLVTWPGHERQWRAERDAIGRRIGDAAALFEAGASDAGLAIARRYGVTHVYLGREERRQFGGDLTDRFASWRTVFETPGASIVKVPR